MAHLYQASFIASYHFELYVSNNYTISLVEKLISEGAAGLAKNVGELGNVLKPA